MNVDSGIQNDRPGTEKLTPAPSQNENTAGSIPTNQIRQKPQADCQRQAHDINFGCRPLLYGNNDSLASVFSSTNVDKDSCSHDLMRNSGSKNGPSTQNDLANIVFGSFAYKLGTKVDDIGEFFMLTNIGSDGDETPPEAKVDLAWQERSVEKKCPEFPASHPTIRSSDYLDLNESSIHVDLKEDLHLARSNEIHKDIPADHLRSIPRSTDAISHQSSSADDAASLNTRNEHCSISSYCTKTQSDDGDERMDGVPSVLPELSPDFVLPINSLLKPIKKNTYNPISQENVAKFLAGTTWHAEAPIDEDKSMWTAKKLPLEPVALVSPSVTTVQLGHQRDRFLESIQVTRTDQTHPPQNIQRDRLHRYPGPETVYSEYMREEMIDEASYETLYIKRVHRIDTQNTDFDLRQRQRETVTKECIPTLLQPPMQKVHPLPLFNAGMYPLL